jgi:hypothetical protein
MNYSRKIDKYHLINDPFNKIFSLYKLYNYIKWQENY